MTWFISTRDEKEGTWSLRVQGAVKGGGGGGGGGGACLISFRQEPQRESNELVPTLS